MHAADYEAHLRAAAERCLADLGGEVRVFESAQNLVRPCESSGALPYVIEVEGTPNLLHELVHVLFLGRLEKDHGTDPSRIPFDMHEPGGRRLLFEELVCCALSCAWHPGDAATVMNWFREQVGIQGLFFGCANEREFLGAAGEVLAARAEELQAVEQHGRRLLTAALERSGAPPVVRSPRHPVALGELWRGLSAAG